MRFDKKGVLQIRAPKFMLQAHIYSFIKNNHDWVEREYSKIQDRQENKKYYLYGEEIVETNNMDVFYKKEAKSYITKRCNELAGKYGFTHKGIRITSALTRWGSCSSKKTLNFSYRLIMTPKECIDYVIIHELCHLRQMNHSAKFWKEVSDIMPEYKQCENHLKEK